MARWYKELPDGRVRVYVSVGSGASRRTRSKTYPPITTAQKEKALEVLYNALEEEFLYNEQETTPNLARFFSLWLNRRRATLSPVSVDDYENIMNAYVLPYFGDRPLIFLTPARLEDHYQRLLMSFSVSTVRLVHATLCTIMKDALRWNYLEENPMRHTRVPKGVKKRARALLEPEMQALKTALQEEKPSFRCIVLLGLFCGLRRGEIAGLNVEDINVEGKRIHVCRASVNTKSGKLLKSTKSGTQRDVPVPSALLDDLMTIIGDRTQGALFLNSRGTERIAVQSITSGWLKFLKRHPDLPRVRFHDLRHTAASLLLSHGIDVVQVSRLLGHTNPHTTLITYSHIVKDKDDEIRAVFDQIE